MKKFAILFGIASLWLLFSHTAFAKQYPASLSIDCSVNSSFICVQRGTANPATYVQMTGQVYYLYPFGGTDISPHPRVDYCLQTSPSGGTTNCWAFNPGDPGSAKTIDISSSAPPDQTPYRYAWMQANITHGPGTLNVSATARSRTVDTPTISANPGTINVNQTSTITYAATDAFDTNLNTSDVDGTAGLVDPGTVNGGSYTYTANRGSGTANFQVAALGPDNNGNPIWKTANASVTVNKQPTPTPTPTNAPTVDLKCNGTNGPCTVATGGTATLSWTSTNATTCTASGNWSGAKATSGSESSPPISFLSFPRTLAKTVGGAIHGLVEKIAALFHTQTAQAINTCNPNDGVVCDMVRQNSSYGWWGSTTIPYGSSADVLMSSNHATGQGSWASNCYYDLNYPSGWINTSTLSAPNTNTRNWTTTITNLTATRTVAWQCFNNVYGWATDSAVIWVSAPTPTPTPTPTATPTPSPTATPTPTPPTSTFTITCTGPGGSTSDSVNVVAGPAQPPTVSITSASQPDYCTTGPAAIATWQYTSPSGLAQANWQLQVFSNTISSGSMIYDSGKKSGTTNTAGTGQGVLAFNTTYKVRVRVWDAASNRSGWATSATALTTPAGPYPQVLFTVVPVNPTAKQAAIFTDKSIYDASDSHITRQWDFGDGTVVDGSATQSYQYATDTTGMKATLSVSSSNTSGTFCSATKTFNVQKAIPNYKEVAPGL